MGEMADMYDYAIWPEDFDEPYSKGKPVTCQRCGKKKLEWGTDSRRWYLIDSEGNPHICPRSTPQEDFA